MKKYSYIGGGSTVTDQNPQVRTARTTGGWTSRTRERRTDLLEYRVEESVDAETFADHRQMEAFRSGWVAVGYAFDPAGRVLLAYDAAEDHWRVPGGTLQPGESLREGLRREITEETGVEVQPRDPRAVADVVVREEGGDRSTSFSVVSFEATAETTAVGDDLGDDDEHIADADWFSELPDALFERGTTTEILDACERWRW